MARMGRRDFLRLSAEAAAVVGAAAILPRRRVAAAEGPRVAIVGAGLAGMTAAFDLYRRKGWVAQVFEASDHVGGRTRTIRGLSGGQYTEAGGGGISSNEKNIQRLCRRLDLWPLVDTWDDYASGRETYVIGGQHYRYAQLEKGIGVIEEAAWRAWSKMGRRFPRAGSTNAAALQYDEMSVKEFIDATDYDTSTPAGSFVAHNHAVEYGGTSDVASALELVLEQGDFWGSGPYDERLAVPGGNDRIASEIDAQLPGGTVTFGRKLAAVTKQLDGTYTLTFDSGPDVDADHVVVAVPGTALQTVDLADAGISALHLDAIDATRMGTNVKLNLQFAGQPWSASGYNGDSTNDTLITSTWQASFQTANPSILVGMNNQPYPGADAHGSLEGADLTTTLAAVDALFPGASVSFVDGQAYRDVWAHDPLIGGSYTYAPLGWFTNYEGVSERREGNIHFAGEHTAQYKRAGTMAGAVASGARAADEIVADYS